MYLVKCLAVANLKFLIHFEENPLPFHFALGPENHLASPAHHTQGK